MGAKIKIGTKMKMKMNFRMIKEKLGWIGVLTVVTVTLDLWVLSKADISLIFSSELRSFGQVAGLLGAVFLSINYILASRPGFLGPFFGGLDKMIKAKRLLAAFGTLAICFHPIFFALASESSDGVLRYFFPSSNIPYALGVFALYIYLAIIIRSFYLKLSHGFWERSENLTGIFLILFAFHIFYIPSDTYSYLPLRAWVLGLVGFGALAYIYEFGFHFRFFWSRIFHFIHLKVFQKL